MTFPMVEFAPLGAPPSGSNLKRPKNNLQLMLVIGAAVTLTAVVTVVIVVVAGGNKDNGDTAAVFVPFDPPAPSPPDGKLLFFPPSPLPPPSPPAPPHPGPPPPPLDPCLGSGDFVKLALERSELVISNAGGFGPDFGQQHVLRYSNGAQIYSPVLGGFANFDAVLTFDEGYRIADPVNNGRLHSTTVPPTRGVDTHDVTHIKLKRGASSLVSAVLLPTCCESNRPTCNFCDLHAPDPAQCYVEGCCCKGHTLFERGECTDAFKTSLNYSCPQMNEFTEGGVLPSIALIVISFFNLAAGQSVNFYNRSYDRTPLRANSGNDVQSALARNGEVISGTQSLSMDIAVVDHDVLSDVQAANSIAFFKHPSGVTRFEISATEAEGDAIFQIGGESLLCAPPPPPPPRCLPRRRRRRRRPSRRIGRPSRPSPLCRPSSSTPDSAAWP